MSDMGVIQAYLTVCRLIGSEAASEILAAEPGESAELLREKYDLDPNTGELISKCPLCGGDPDGKIHLICAAEKRIAAEGALMAVDTMAEILRQASREEEE